MRNLVLMAVLFFTFSHGFGQAKTSASVARPSLDLLVSRVENYWKALAADNRERASSYVLASDRGKFISGAAPRFRNARLVSIEFGDDRTKVTVTVMVKRTVPPVSAEMDWPVGEFWCFEKGTWYRKYDPQALPILGLTRSKAMTPAQVEAITQGIKKQLQFEATALDFGKVNQGETVVLKVKYRLAGTAPLSVNFRTSAPGSNCPDCDRERGISIRGLKNNSLSPGDQQEFVVDVPTWNYDGEVGEQFTLTAVSNGVEVPFDFSIKGNVYVPLSISPKVLRVKKGEREKEIVLRNNSKKEIELEQVISETRAISLSPFPASIPPGGQLVMVVKVEETLDSAFPNSVDRMAITYKPTDGYSAISYRVYLNYREEKQDKPVATPDGREIQDLIRRNQIVLPNR